MLLDVPACVLWQVDAVTGLVTVKHQANFENHTFVSFNVIAEDGGGRTDTTEVQVTIQDVNDYRPTFVKDFFNLEVPSYTDVGTHMATLRATDNDSGGCKEWWVQGMVCLSDYFVINIKNCCMFIKCLVTLPITRQNSDTHLSMYTCSRPEKQHKVLLPAGI